jgi:hypothetical protein
MSKLKVKWQRSYVANRTGWARTCIALAGGKGARAIVGEYLTEGEQLLERDVLVVSVSPGYDVDNTEVVEVQRVVRSRIEPMVGTLEPATARVYMWRTEHVSLREKLAELLAADNDLDAVGDASSHEREYLTECERLRHYLTRAHDALRQVDVWATEGHVDAMPATELGELISGPLTALERAYPNLLG